MTTKTDTEPEFTSHATRKHKLFGKVMILLAFAMPELWGIYHRTVERPRLAAEKDVRIYIYEAYSDRAVKPPPNLEEKHHPAYDETIYYRMWPFDFVAVRRQGDNVEELFYDRRGASARRFTYL